MICQDSRVEVYRTAEELSEIDQQVKFVLAGVAVLCLIGMGLGLFILRRYWRLYFPQIKDIKNIVQKEATPPPPKQNNEKTELGLVERE